MRWTDGPPCLHIPAEPLEDLSQPGGARVSAPFPAARTKPCGGLPLDVDGQGRDDSVVLHGGTQLRRGRRERRHESFDIVCLK